MKAAFPKPFNKFSSIVNMGQGSLLGTLSSAEAGEFRSKLAFLLKLLVYCQIAIMQAFLVALGVQVSRLEHY